MTSPFTTDRRLGWIAKKNPDRLILPFHPDWLYSPTIPVTTRQAMTSRVRGWGSGSTAVLPDRAALNFLSNITTSGQRPNAVDGSGNRLWVGPDINAAATNGACEANGYSGLTEWGTSTTSRDFNASSNNQIIEGMYVWGRIYTGTFTGVKIRNCVIRGPLTRGTDTSHITGHASQVDDLGDAVIEDCLIWGRPVTVPATYNGKPLLAAGVAPGPGVGGVDNTNGWANDGIRGGRYTVRRTEIRATGDGIGLTGQIGNVTIEGCWIHDNGYCEWNDPDDTGNYVNSAGQTVAGAGYYMGYPGNYTHGDGVQFHRGKVYRIRGNVIGGTQANGRWAHNTGHYLDIVGNDDMYNSSFMIQQEVDATEANRIDDVIIENNLLGGGIATINMTVKNGNTLPGVIIRGNRFMRKTTGTGQTAIFYILIPLAGGQPTMGQFSNNVMDDTGLPVPYSAGG
jgi:hypothetical protein